MLPLLLIAFTLLAYSTLRAKEYAGHCNELLEQSITEGHLKITSAKILAASDKHTEHCLVDGKINTRTGIDGQSYAIKFRLRMPTKEWNGNLYTGGGGGINGRVIDPQNMTLQGYATLGTDSGHDSVLNSHPDKGGTAAFGLDPQARIDFAYNAYDVVAQVGKAMIRQFHGIAPKYSYYVGCSEGGREGLLMSQRFPEHYDGIVAGAPVLHLPLGPLSGVYTTQLFANLAIDFSYQLPNGDPNIARTFSDQDLMLVSKSVLRACDLLDGVNDGIVNDIAHCQSPLVDAQLKTIACKAEKNELCLHPNQISTLQLAMAGAKNSNGNVLYSDWPWDAGISGCDGKKFNMAWRNWWLGKAGESKNTAKKLVYAPALATLYSVPPKIIKPEQGVLAFSLSYDFDIAPSRIRAVNDVYKHSAEELFITDETNLTPFKNKGGKLIVYHGASDAAVSMNDTRQWFEQVGVDTKGGTDDFSKLYLVPGMGHCRGGPATDSFDLFGKVKAWVEHDIAPEAVIATAKKPEYFGVPARSGLLCPYPKQSIYKGIGDINQSNSFTCK